MIFTYGNHRYLPHMAANFRMAPVEHAKDAVYAWISHISHIGYGIDHVFSLICTARDERTTVLRRFQTRMT